MGPLLAAIFLAAASISLPARLLSKRHFVLICSVLAACSYPLCQGAWKCWRFLFPSQACRSIAVG